MREALTFFAGAPKVVRRLQVLDEIGLGYLRLGQPATTLSGGEAQRIKIASHLGSQSGERMLYVLDEPTTGLHFDDIVKLLAAFRKLLHAGHSLLVIEHNLDVLKTADWIIDLGPEGGEAGGYLVAAGTPEQVARATASYTGHHLRRILAAAAATARSPSRRNAGVLRCRSTHAPRSTVLTDLIGKVLVHDVRGRRTAGVIVEAEAYIGESDPACHAAPGPTTRNAPLYGPPGLAYVYLNYGIHYLVNAVTEAEGSPAAVLIRALEPLEGVDLMARRRKRTDRSTGERRRHRGLCRGPGQSDGRARHHARAEPRGPDDRAAHHRGPRHRAAGAGVVDRGSDSCRHGTRCGGATGRNIAAVSGQDRSVLTPRASVPVSAAMSS